MQECQVTAKQNTTNYLIRNTLSNYMQFCNEFGVPCLSSEFLNFIGFPCVLMCMEHSLGFYLQLTHLLFQSQSHNHITHSQSRPPGTLFISHTNGQFEHKMSDTVLQASSIQDRRVRIPLRTWVGLGMLGKGIPWFHKAGEIPHLPQGSH